MQRGFEKYYQFLSHWFSGNGLFLLYRGFLGYQDVPKRVNGQFYILFSFASFSYYKFFNYRGHY